MTFFFSLLFPSEKFYKFGTFRYTQGHPPVLQNTDGGTDIIERSAGSQDLKISTADTTSCSRAHIHYTCIIHHFGGVSGVRTRPTTPPRTRPSSTLILTDQRHPGKSSPRLLRTAQSPVSPNTTYNIYLGWSVAECVRRVPRGRRLECYK